MNDFVSSIFLITKLRMMANTLPNQTSNPIYAGLILLALQVFANWVFNLGNFQEQLSFGAYILVIGPFSIAIMAIIILCISAKDDFNPFAALFITWVMLAIAVLTQTAICPDIPVFDIQQIRKSADGSYFPWSFFKETLAVFKQYYSKVSLLNFPISIWFGVILTPLFNE
jgi:hypothetical protein